MPTMPCLALMISMNKVRSTFQFSLAKTDEPDDEIPAHIAFDKTSQGRLWDPTLSAYYYIYSPTSNEFSPANEATPVNYLYFQGRWGDQEYTDEVKGQESFHGFHKWTGGPQGPMFKHLDRKDVCLPRDGDCIIKDSL